MTHVHRPPDSDENSSDAENGSFHPAIRQALEAPQAGRMIRLLSPISKGVSRTEDQIASFAAIWRTRAEQALSDERPVLVALGDSLAQGIGADHPDHGYVGLVASATNDCPVVNLSRSGARIGDVIETQLPALAAIEQPIFAVTCTVGSNDLVRGARLGRAKAQLSQLLDDLPDGAVLATLPAHGSMMAKAINRHIRAEAPATGVALADVGQRLDSWRGRSAPDRFHPNGAGYELWAETFLDVLRAGPDCTT